jgi:hypothetical protein
MSLKFEEARFVIAFANNIRPEKSGTFTSRVQSWQKLDFPEGTRSGRGVKAEYGAKQIFQLAIMMKLQRLGLTPERAIKVVKQGWPGFRDGIIETLMCHYNGETHLHYFVVQLDAISDLSDPEADHMHIFVETITEGMMLEAWMEPDDDWSEVDKNSWRNHAFYIKNRLACAITIEIDSMLMLIWAALGVRKFSPDLFADEFAEWEASARQGRAAQEDEAQFNPTRYDRQSVAGHNSLRDKAIRDVDHIEYARAALSKLPESSLQEHP